MILVLGHVALVHPTANFLLCAVCRYESWERTQLPCCLLYGHQNQTDTQVRAILPVLRGCAMQLGSAYLSCYVPVTLLSVSDAFLPRAASI
jgi:hypothetical protein